LQDFIAIAAAIKALPEFAHSNAIGNNKYSSALDRYAEYLAEGPTEPTLDLDLQALKSDTSIGDTTRTALIEARLGQGRFRAALIDKFGGRCAVTGVAVVELLRASHIKPWAHATNDERLDPENGLLLTPTLDVLFDRGFISFDSDGSVISLRPLDQGAAAQLGPIGNLISPPSPLQTRYLQYHADLHGHRA
jgi:putative restriction endonuclease